MTFSEVFNPFDFILKYFSVFTVMDLSSLLLLNSIRFLWFRQPREVPVCSFNEVSQVRSNISSHNPNLMGRVLGQLLSYPTGNKGRERSSSLSATRFTYHSL